MQLNEKAWTALTASDEHLFLTGKAGTGKSTLIKAYIDWLRGQDRSVAVLATTGMAALQIGGQTVYSFFGFKPNITVKETALTAAVASRIAACDIIVIDEVSMLRADLMDCVCKLLKQYAVKAGSPLSSKRLVLVGDLFQLPPVVTCDMTSVFSGGIYDSPYFFSSKEIKKFKLQMIELTEVYRQTDSKFLDALNAIRSQKGVEGALSVLNEKVGIYSPKKKTMRLCALNRHVEDVNNRELAQLAREPVFFQGKNNGIPDRLLPVSEQVVLKLGAQVMTVANHPRGDFVNGTTGVVVGFIEKEDDSGNRVQAVEVETEDAIITVIPYTWEMTELQVKQGKRKKPALHPVSIGSFTQIPIKLAWAGTIHKSQGQQYDNVHIELPLGALFAPGQLYVALSRCTSLEGLSLNRKITEQDVRVDPAVVEYYDKLRRPDYKNWRPDEYRREDA